MSKHQTDTTELLNDIYDILAQNNVDPSAKDELLRRIEYVDNVESAIYFDTFKLSLIIKQNY